MSSLSWTGLGWRAKGNSGMRSFQRESLGWPFSWVFNRTYGPCKITAGICWAVMDGRVTLKQVERMESFLRFPSCLKEGSSLSCWLTPLQGSTMSFCRKQKVTPPMQKIHKLQELKSFQKQALKKQGLSPSRTGWPERVALGWASICKRNVLAGHQKGLGIADGESRTATPSEVTAPGGLY